MNQKVVLVARILLGLMLVVFGLNKFFQFLPPFELPEAAQILFGALIGSYVMPTVAIIEIITGIAFLVNRYVPLAAIVLIPITINFVLFHAFLDLPNIAPGIVAFALNIVLIVAHWDKFKPLLEAKN